MSAPQSPESRTWAQHAIDKLLLLALLLVIGLSMRACVRSVADAIGLGNLTSEERAAHERAALSSD